jgi:hypothetical protein
VRTGDPVNLVGGNDVNRAQEDVWGNCLRARQPNFKGAFWDPQMSTQLGQAPCNFRGPPQGLRMNRGHLSPRSVKHLLPDFFTYVYVRCNTYRRSVGGPMEASQTNQAVTELSSDG